MVDSLLSVPVPENRIALLGGGAHAACLLLLFDDADRLDEVHGVLDDGTIDRDRLGYDVPHLGVIDDLASTGSTHYLAALGWPRPRADVVARVAPTGIPAMTLVDGEARLARGNEVGEGSVICGGTRIALKSSVGRHAFIAHGVMIGHHCTVGDYALIPGGVTLNGDVHIGEGAVIGSNATVAEGVTVGAWAKVSAGSAVMKDVPPGATVVGVPAMGLLEHARAQRGRR